MRKKLINLSILFILLYFTFYIFKNKYLVISTISTSLKIWSESIFTSLLPIFIISDILINYDTSKYLILLEKPISKLFNINNKSSLAFILSIISGFPSGARNIKNLYQNNEISKKEAEKLLIFTHFASPLFILGTTALLFFKNDYLGLPILISHYSSGIILGIMFRNYTKDITKDTKQINNDTKFTNIFISSIKKSMDTLLLILGIMSFFLVISNIITMNLNLAPYNESLLKSIIEVTQGLESLGNLNLRNYTLITLGSMFLSFGGLSVHIQVISQITDTDIPYLPFSKEELFILFYHL